MRRVSRMRLDKAGRTQSLAGRLGALAAAALLSACALPVLPPSDAPLRDEAGYTTRITLDVVQSKVKAFNADVDIPRRGSCSFHGPFTQTREKPSVQLRAPDGCTVDIFEQGKAVTVGFANCASRCTRGASDYLWPIIVDRTNGQCH